MDVQNNPAGRAQGDRMGSRAAGMRQHPLTRHTALVRRTPLVPAPRTPGTGGSVFSETRNMIYVFTKYSSILVMAITWYRFSH